MPKKDGFEEIRSADSHGPIQAQYREAMNELARSLDKFFNGDLEGEDRKVGFVLLTAEFGVKGRVNYISNGDRSDMVQMMQELIKRFKKEGKVR